MTKQPQPREHNGVPLCVETCSCFDGKRCELLGARPGNICEPAVVTLSRKVKKLEQATEGQPRAYTTTSLIALAATVRDEAKRLEILNLPEGGEKVHLPSSFTTHTMRCQTLYAELCAQAEFPSENLTPAAKDFVKLSAKEHADLSTAVHAAVAAHLALDAKEPDAIHTAALKVVEAMDVDAREIKVPGALALALLNLRNAVKRGQGTFEERVADVLARKCDELEAENEELKRKCGA